MGRKDSGHKKSKHRKKSSHKKKHKKVKKKSKHYRKSSESSSSDSSSNSSNGDRKTDSVAENITHFNDESKWNDLFSDRHTITRERNVQKKNRDILDEPRQSTRELNPYWKDGGNGLPPNLNECKSSIEKNYDVKYLKGLLEKAKDSSEVTGIPVEEIIEEEWGSLTELKKIIENEENKTYNSESCNKRSFQYPASPAEPESSKTVTDCIERQKSFMKPGEISDSKFTNTYKRNWKKKEVVEELHSHQVIISAERNDTDKTEKKRILTPDELNTLAAKAMKAEIMGNKILCEQLRKEIEIAKKNREEISDPGVNKSEKQKEEIVVLTKTNLAGMTKPCESSDYISSNNKRRKRKGETHKGNERVRYFMDDEKHSLKSMFEKEKFSTDHSDEMFLKMAKRGKIRGDDLDDDFLDRARNSEYERKEKEKERYKTINEAKAKHRSLSHCRWCLDGNNVQKHLIISIGSKCYLCLPSDESLTNGHCLIVPVHHDTCGTLLDEDVWNEMQLYRASLCKMFEESGQDVVFFENARSFHRFPHMVLHCVPMDKEVGDLAPIYFKKAIMESEMEWSNNKKLIDLRNKDLRRSVPKGLPYFAVDFGMEGGFAHVIEDEKLFPPKFAEEIIGGMLDLDAFKWRKRRKESLENQMEKVAEFTEKWKKYECSERGKTVRSRSSSSTSD